MLHSLWMRPALQKSEAVLMPALQRTQVAEQQFSDLYYHRQPQDKDYIPIAPNVTTTALSTYVRPRGSIGGRSVLRAAGVMESPFMRRGKPQYYQPKKRWPLAAGRVVNESDEPTDERRKSWFGKA